MSRTERMNILRAATAYIGKLWLPSLADGTEKYLKIGSDGEIKSGAGEGGGSGNYNPPIPISDVSGLQTALNSKASLSHTHSQSDVTNLTTTLATKPTMIITAVASGSVTAGALGRLINDGGTLKVKQVSRTQKRLHMALTGNTTNTLSSVSCVTLSGVTIVAYRNSSGYPVVQAIDTSTGITLGTSVTLTSNSATGLSIATNGTNAVVTYTRSSQVYAVAMTVSGTTITAGSETAVTGMTSTLQWSLCWHPTAARYCLAGLITNVGIQTFTVSGTTITLNNNATIGVGAAIYQSGLIYDAVNDKLMFTYLWTNANHRVRGVVITPGSPDTITFQNEINYDSSRISTSANQLMTIHAFNKNLIFVNRQDITNVPDRKLVMFEVDLSGTTPVSTYKGIIDQYGILEVGAVCYDGEYIILAYPSIARASYCYQAIKLVGSTWVKAKPCYIQYSTIATGQAKYIGMAYNSTTGNLVAVHNLESTTSTQGFVIVNPIDERLWGDVIIQESKSDGQNCSCVLRGYSSAAHSDLIAGEDYYWQDDGTLGLAMSIEYAGNALSSTILNSQEAEAEKWL